jgi:hypothetical protein
MDQPIACSLDNSAAASQLDEWRRLLAALVTSVERPDAAALRMGLRPDPDGVAALTALAQREAACCPFFRFAIEIDVNGFAFTIATPLDAAPILDQFAQLAPS